MSDSARTRSLARRLFEAESLEGDGAVPRVIVIVLLGFWTLVVLFSSSLGAGDLVQGRGSGRQRPLLSAVRRFHADAGSVEIHAAQSQQHDRPLSEFDRCGCSSTLLALLIGSLAAYALVRIRFQVKLAAVLTFIVLLVAVIIAVAALGSPGRRLSRWRSRFPPGAWHIRPKVQRRRWQQRHRVLDDLQPDHVANRRSVADLRHVPAPEAARHPDRVRHTYTGVNLPIVVSADA